MKLVIPMAGFGTRFQQAGYTGPKPLIPVHGKPMIEWVLRMFPGQKPEDMLFICQRDHLEQTPLGDVLWALAPESTIVSIEGHKGGPVKTLLDAKDYLPDDELLVSYCDYFMEWSYPHFQEYVAAHPVDGAVICYTGFHPHLLVPGNVYAGCRLDAEGDVAEVREKHCFESNKLQALHSAGAYYFRSGGQVKHYLEQLSASGQSINGELYASQLYQPMIADGLRVAAPTPILHFCQWGTPTDLKEYNDWLGYVGAWAA